MFNTKITHKGFSIIEMIIAITIVAILATIAIIGYNGYSENARDSVRLSNINTISQLLEEYSKNTGHYPSPDNATTITWSGYTAWYQGTIGDIASTTINLSPKLKDPIYLVDYTYSITGNGKYYQLASIFEGNSNIGYDNSPLVQTIYATTPNMALVKGNYNQLILTVRDPLNKTLFIASPSIILSDLSKTDLSLGTSFSTGSFVINKRKNIPLSYSGVATKQSGDFYYTPKNIGTVAGMPLKKANLTDFMEKTKLAYSGTELAFEKDNNTKWDTIIQFSSGSEDQTKMATALFGSISGGAYVLALSDLPTTLCNAGYYWDEGTSTCILYM